MFDNVKIHKIEISHKTVVFIVLFLLGIWFVYQIRLVLLMVFIAFILMTALSPIVAFLQKLKLPRFLAILITFIFVITIIGGVFAGIIPTLIEQTGVLASAIITYLKDAHLLANFDDKMISSQIQTISSSLVNVLKLLVGAFSNIIAIFSLLVLTFYSLLERPRLPDYLRIVFADGNKEEKYLNIIEAVEKRLGGWVRGELMLMFIVGFMTYLGLILLNMPFALPLALLAGLLELVPNLGPTLAAVPAIVVALTISTPITIGVLILAIAVQQLENNIIVPFVMRQSLGLKPLVTLLCLMIGITIGGIGGAILAVPTFITVQTVFTKFIKK